MPDYELTSDAVKDLKDILRYTTREWGLAQQRKYRAQLAQCMKRLARGDGHYKILKGLSESVRVTHCQHHYIFGLEQKKAQPLLIIAILHERMDILRRLRARLDN